MKNVNAQSPCSHQWEPTYGSPWGTIIGVSKCVRCGHVARSDDFPRPCPSPSGSPEEPAT